VKIRLLVVGRPRDPDLARVHERYVQRIRALGVAFDEIVVRETRAGGRYDDEHVRLRESEALLERHEGAGRLVALDRAGSMLDSAELAERLAAWATPRLSLAVGGPLGHHAALLERADALWSLSRLTLPHEFVRALVAEQLYRALTIRRGHPYHK
jgi:23S rRNA (pseudouridine1915-N3)-methyltransferase